MQTCNEVTTYTVASLKTFHPFQPYMTFLDVHVTRYVTAVHDTAVADHCCSQAVVYCLFDTSTHGYTSLFFGYKVSVVYCGKACQLHLRFAGLVMCLTPR